MLLQLTIKNYVLIENQSIDFQSGFSVLTGETGAGKSIILGALGLIMGDRADTDVVMDESKKCIVEGQFSVEKLNLKDFFDENDLDYEQSCILRREVTKSGKSRAFVNDTPVNLQVLKELSSQLMDIHSQNQNQQLNSSAYRLDIIDAYADHQILLSTYRSDYKNYQEDVKKLEQLKVEYRSKLNEQEFNQYLFDEIEQVKVSKGEQLDLEEELKILSNAEEIKTALFKTADQINLSEENSLHQFQLIFHHLNKVAPFHERIQNISDRLSSLIIEMKDIGEEAESLMDDFQFDPQRLDWVNERLQQLFSLSRKHGLEKADELLDFQEELSSRIHSLMDMDEQIKQLEIDIKKKYTSLHQQARELRKNRLSAIQQIENLLIKQLIELGMPKAEIQFDLTELPEINKDGIDSNQFLFKANSGSKLTEVKKAASGGELSRLMLSFKYILALRQSIPSIIFDEIDSGVSGEIADKLARVMVSLGEQIQVISISHLPQIAAKAKNHYLVYKQNESIFTRSKIKKLNQQERLNEVAAMLSGAEIGASAIEHAKELLGSKN